MHFPVPYVKSIHSLWQSLINFIVEHNCRYAKSFVFFLIFEKFTRSGFTVSRVSPYADSLWFMYSTKVRILSAFTNL